MMFLVCMMLLVLIDFDDLYVDYERDDSIPKKTVGAQKLILDLLKERAETGRIYIMNIDHCNSHSSFKDKVEYEQSLSRNHSSNISDSAY